MLAEHLLQHNSVCRGEDCSHQATRQCCFTNTDTHTLIHTHTYTLRHTHTQTQTHSHRHTQTYPHTHRQTHSQTQTHTLTQTQTHSHTHSHTPSSLPSSQLGLLGTAPAGWKRRHHTGERLIAPGPSANPPSPLPSWSPDPIGTAPQTDTAGSTDEWHARRSGHTDADMATWLGAPPSQGEVVRHPPGKPHRD